MGQARNSVSYQCFVMFHRVGKLVNIFVRNSCLLCPYPFIFLKLTKPLTRCRAGYKPSGLLITF